MAFGGDVPAIPYDTAAAVQSLADIKYFLLNFSSFLVFFLRVIDLFINLKAVGADWVCIVLSYVYFYFVLSLYIFLFFGLFSDRCFVC
jgi:hypothetical protein